MAIATVITRGYGNGTFSGTIPLVVTRGYTIGEEIDISVWIKLSDSAITWTKVSDNSDNWTKL